MTRFTPWRRWCRKAPKGEKPRKRLIVVMLFITYEIKGKWRADFHLKVKRLTMICASLALLQIMFAVHPAGWKYRRRRG